MSTFAVMAVACLQIYGGKAFVLVRLVRTDGLFVFFCFSGWKFLLTFYLVGHVLLGRILFIVVQKRLKGTYVHSNPSNH